MTLTTTIEGWVRDAERMNNGPALAVVVTGELFAVLAEEQAQDPPLVAGLAVLTLDGDAPSDMIEIPGPDRVAIYVGRGPDESPYPAGLDPAMPVVFVPVPPDHLDDRDRLEMYNRLRWYGLSPAEALAGS